MDCNRGRGRYRLSCKDTAITSADSFQMKFSPHLLLVVFTAITGVAMAIATPAQAADDQETIIKRNGSYTTSKGGSGTTSSVTTRSNGNVQRNGNWTNAAGGTGSFQSQRTYNRVTQSANVSGSVTRPNGKTSTYQGTAVRTAPGVVSSNGTIPRPTESRIPSRRPTPRWRREPGTSRRRSPPPMERRSIARSRPRWPTAREHGR